MVALEAISYPMRQQGVRQTFNTPGLVLDLDALEHNIAYMARTMTAAGKRLRPHSKSHKCPKIALAQIAAGAAGVCCATLDEAEIMAANGVSGILLTSPITTPEKILRLMDLLRAAPDTQVVVDNVDNVRALSQAARMAEVSVPVLLDIEIGFGRTGVVDVDQAETVARAIDEKAELRFDGVQAYGGHLQHTADYHERLALSTQAHAFIEAIIKRLSTLGMPPPLVTGGGTGTHAIDSQSGPFTEIQAGSYIFMDADYERIAYRPGENWPFRNSLFVQTTVISANRTGMVTTDAGSKAFALNGEKPRIVTNGYERATYEYLGDEHGRVNLFDRTIAPVIGAKLECVPSHCDPTVALYDRYLCVRGDSLVDVWPILARGRR